MYYLSVCALFKNEEHCLKEWIEHYILHGVEHFYLINDLSTDKSVEIIQEYVEKKIVTLYHNKSHGNYIGRQRNMYNEFVLHHIKNKDTKWLLIVDLDEFMWCPNHVDLTKILHNCEHLGQIQVAHTLYGSNEFIEQPKYIVKSFTKRSNDQPTNNANYKYFVNSSYDFLSLNVHHATFSNYEHEKHNFIILGPEHFILNHYCCQSFNFWKDIKCTRGDSDAYYNYRTEEYFKNFDINELDDYRLSEQNKNLFI